MLALNIIDVPEPNFVLKMGDGEMDFQLSFCVKKTPLNRLKYWLFCKFFPFKIVKWDKE